jgi:hypothetical protein
MMSAANKFSDKLSVEQSVVGGKERHGSIALASVHTNDGDVENEIRPSNETEVIKLLSWIASMYVYAHAIRAHSLPELTANGTTERNQEPILRLPNLQLLQRQRCSRLVRFYIRAK